MPEESTSIEKRKIQTPCGNYSCFSANTHVVLGIGYAPTRLALCEDHRHPRIRVGSVRIGGPAMSPAGVFVIGRLPLL